MQNSNQETNKNAFSDVLHMLFYFFRGKQTPHATPLKKAGLKTMQGEDFLLWNPGFNGIKLVSQDQSHWTENTLKPLFCFEQYWDFSIHQENFLVRLCVLPTQPQGDRDDYKLSLWTTKTGRGLSGFESWQDWKIQIVPLLLSKEALILNNK